MVNTDIYARLRWKYEFNKAAGTWPCAGGLHADVPPPRGWEQGCGEPGFLVYDQKLRTPHSFGSSVLWPSGK